MIIMMDKKFTVLTECELAKVDGGKGSSYVAGLGGAIFGVPCAI